MHEGQQVGHDGTCLEEVAVCHRTPFLSSREVDRRDHAWQPVGVRVAAVALLVLTACGATGVREVSTGPSSGCELAGDTLSCGHQTFELTVPELRVVHVALPSRAAPAAGFPVVVMFQGSLFSAARTWSATQTDVAGAFWQTSTVQALLDAGFAVVAPEVRFFGVTFWDTNVPQWSAMWANAPDHRLVAALLAAIDRQDFGALDGSRLYATGISSGGYMTSRMALSYPGRFRALAIHSASWATCGGPVCILPETLPADHPPTLFVHGENDLIVPIDTMRAYDTKLRDSNVETRTVTVSGAGHAWLEQAVVEVPAFFLRH